MNHFQPRHRLQAFSLLELLVVIGIMALMMSLLVPSIAGFSSTAGRRGAVNVVMNTLEQARVEALQSGRTVHVVLIQEKDATKDSIVVVREPEEKSGAWTYERLTKTIRLPEGVLFHAAQNSLLSQGLPNGFDQSRIDRFPADAAGFGVMSFNASGAVEFPQSTSPVSRQVFLTEGVRGSTETAKTERKRQGGGFEVISVSRYTGRVQLDITGTGT